MSFDQLTQLALRGVERWEGPAAGADGPSSPSSTNTAPSLAFLQAQVSRIPSEHHLLSQAVLAGLHEQIGRLPAQDPSPAPTPAPAEHQARVTRSAHVILQNLLGGETPQLLPEWLKLAAAHGRIVHPEALPALLTLGAQKPELRPGITPVLGHRGVWLAHHFPPGSWVHDPATPEASPWETGSPESRLAFLQHTRQTHPDRARELLAQTWNQESPDDRARLVATFEIGLSSNDEPFLESALDDRRMEVRRASVRLLARLPESRWAGRMRERVSPLLTWVPGTPGGLLGLREAQPARLEVILPAACDKPMQRDGIEAKPLPGFGEKAGWLIQMLEFLPLHHWTHTWQTTPSQIVAASDTGECANELFEAWTRAALFQSQSDWAEALFESAVRNQRITHLPKLLSVLRPDQREAQMLQLLNPDNVFIRPFLGTIVACLDHPWTQPFSRTMIAFLQQETSRVSGNWALRDGLASLAVCFSPAVLPDLFSGWSADPAPWAFWSSGVEALLRAAQCRIEIQRAFSHP